MSTDSPTFLKGSFRDRNGRIFLKDGEVHRALSARALEEWQALSQTRFFPRLVGEGKIVATEQVSAGGTLPPEELQAWSAVLWHERVPVVTYPYEWCFGMLKDAALLQVELLLAALDEDTILKDSSAFNFQWRGTSPVFIDVLSFERYLEGEPWVGYRQFCQFFLNPLMLQAYKDVAFHDWLRGNIDGIEPGRLNQLFSLRDRLRRGVLPHVYLHAKLQKSFGSTQTDIGKAMKSGGFQKEMVRQNVKRVGRLIERLEWKAARSEWSEYVEDNSYSGPDLEIKQEFVREVIAEKYRGTVWDCGCNTGQFSRLAAVNSDTVLALDSDHLSIERLYQTLKQTDNRTILPLVYDISQPSPGLGWAGSERLPLTERSSPDLVLCLALIHHVVISANIPLEEFVGWLESLDTEVVIEYVSKQDPMVEKLLLNKRDDYSDYEQEFFENCLARRFQVVRKVDLPSGTRALYYARPMSRGSGQASGSAVADSAS